MEVAGETYRVEVALEGSIGARPIASGSTWWGPTRWRSFRKGLHAGDPDLYLSVPAGSIDGRANSDRSSRPIPPRPARRSARPGPARAIPGADPSRRSRPSRTTRGGWRIRSPWSSAATSTGRPTTSTTSTTRRRAGPASTGSGSRSRASPPDPRLLPARIARPRRLGQPPGSPARPDLGRGQVLTMSPARTRWRSSTTASASGIRPT